MNVIAITVGKKLFEYMSYADWQRNARMVFESHHVTTSEVICVDAMGRLCVLGSDFKMAEQDESYPINVYSVRVDPTLIPDLCK